MLFESGTGPDSASLKLGPVGRTGAAAAWQTLVRISDALAIPSLILAVIWLGMPHQAALSVAYLSIFDWAAINALNSWHASFGVALRSPAVRIAAAFFSASSRSWEKSLAQGGSCCGAGPNCAFALPAKNAATHMTGKARRKRMKSILSIGPIITV